MNSYNENLRNSVVASLQSQELERKKIKGQLSASMLTLYYAEGATITANERLLAAQQVLRFKEKVKTQAVKASNVSNNLLLAENDINQYMKQSVTNASVAAANVQVAATAILKLASDLGGIFSIVNAADYHTDIYKQAKAARDYMNDTAYAAEFTSQLAMETTMLTSEVSFPTVLDDAKSMNTQMNNLLKVISDDYDAAAQTVTNDNAFEASLSADEKKAEGALEDISVDYQATDAAYNAVNWNLNLGLKAVAGQYAINEAPPPPPNMAVAKRVKGTKNTDFTVMFNLLTSPFEQLGEPPLYPVKEYRIIIVKDSNKTTFDLSAAESLLADNNLCQCIPIGPVMAPPGAVDPIQNIIKVEVEPGNTVYDIVRSFNIYDYPYGHLIDSDGNIITIGTDYVIFVLAVLRDDYKKRINNFDDYLSAPSSSFHLTIVLQRAKDLKANLVNNSITFQVANDQESSDYKVEYRGMLIPMAATDQPSTKKLLQSLLQLVNFDLAANELLIADLLKNIQSGNVINEVLIAILLDIVDTEVALDEAKIIRLQEDRKSGLVPKDMLTTKLLKTLDGEVNELQQIADKYDPLIAAAEQELLELAPDLKNKADEDIDPFENMKDGHNDLLKVAKEFAHHHDLGEEKTNFNNALAKLEKLVAEKKAALQQVQTDINTDSSVTGTPPFFFNREIAESIPTGDYIVATPLYLKSSKTKGKASANPDDTTQWQFGFGDDPNDDHPRLLTDNFGNLLVDHKEYLPVVLAFAAEPGEKAGQFENSLSHIRIADKFTFKNLTH